jgi:hypothetical protein
MGKRVLNLGTVETLGSDAYLTPRERRLAGLPKDAPSKVPDRRLTKRKLVR